MKIDKDFLVQGLDNDQGCEYLEIRYQDKYDANYQFKDKDISSTTGSREGISVRALYKGSWGQTSTSITTKESLMETVDKAVKLAKNSASFKESKITLAEIKIYEDHLISPRIKSLMDWSVEEKLKGILDAAKVQKDYELVRSLMINYNEVIDNRIVVTNEGTRISWEDMKPTLMAYGVAIDKQTGKMGVGYSSWAHTMGLEFFDLHPIAQLAEEAAQKATKLAQAPIIPGGMTNVLLGPQMVGVLAHEAVGHTAEADLVQMGSFTKDKIGEKVCDENITMIDSPTKHGSKWMGAGWVPYDDEGVKGTEVKLITNGVMTGYMNNRAFAGEMGMEATGNARAYTFIDEPIVRMRNTYIEPGDMSYEELYEAVGEGYLLKTLQNGQADSNGEYMFGAVEAYKIEKGELTDQLFQNPVLTGNAFETLSNIIGIGKDFELTLGAGFCGKEQPAKVDAGGPFIALKAMLAGGN
ncbi:MAG: TldD/PmbA family protein [Candidatus Heimdallarchaeota archaeon]|nr:TldD/PmbA family protein [Candidatus Heimdallarchaeota archaeon]